MEDNDFKNSCFILTGGFFFDIVLWNNLSRVGHIYAFTNKGISDNDLIEFSIDQHYTRPQDNGPIDLPYFNKFHQYNLFKGNEEDWLRYKTKLMDIDPTLPQSEWIWIRKSPIW